MKTNEGAKSGNILKLDGTGFPEEKSDKKVEIKVGKLKCNIIK